MAAIANVAEEGLLTIGSYILLKTGIRDSDDGTEGGSLEGVLSDCDITRDTCRLQHVGTAEEALEDVRAMSLGD